MDGGGGETARMMERSHSCPGKWAQLVGRSLLTFEFKVPCDQDTETPRVVEKPCGGAVKLYENTIGLFRPKRRDCGAKFR